MENLNRLVDGISDYLSKWLKEKKSFNTRSFYGETFTLLMLNHACKLDIELKEILLGEYDQKDKNSESFHFEFNNYAFANLLKLKEDQEYFSRLYPLKFKYTSCTNWTLLRANTCISLNHEKDKAIEEAKNKVDNFQLKSGLILDDIDVKSFQYHCFSTAMLGEIYLNTQDDFFFKAFIRGVQFIKKFILPNGCSLYVGRGQEQSFGYGALIYILSLYFKFTGCQKTYAEISTIVDYVDSYQNESGNIPLVLNQLNLSKPLMEVDLKNEEYSGWYMYNNHFDYLPFLGVFLSKAKNILQNLDAISKIKFEQEQYKDSNFDKRVFPKYVSIVSKPGGYWTNDLPIPLIYSSGSCHTPIYGGEQFFPSLVSEKTLPLPYFQRVNKSIRWKSKSYLIKNSLIMIGPLGLMFRNYNYQPDEIKIKTIVLSPLKVKHYIFKSSTSNDLQFESSPNLILERGNWGSPLGNMLGFSTSGIYHLLTLKIKDL